MPPPAAAPMPRSPAARARLRPARSTAAEDLASGRAVERLSDLRLDAPSSVLAEGDEAFAVDARFFTPVTPDTRYDIIVLQLGE